MKKWILMFLLACSACCVYAESLIVTKEGKSMWASSVKQEGDVVKYMDRLTGEEKTVPLVGLHGVVRTVERGVQYTPDQMQKYIDTIKKLQKLHQNLFRELNSILQEWEALQKPSAELEGDIDRLAGEFKASDKGTKAYKKIVLDLGMVKYKDMQGKYAAQIENVLAEMKADYVNSNMEQLEKIASGAAALTSDQFVAFEILSKDVMHETEGEKKAFVENQLQKTREVVYNSLCSSGYQAFIKTKSIDAYLESARILLAVKEQVAETPEQKDGIEKRIKALTDLAAKAQPAYRLEQDGFAFTGDDMSLMNNASRVTFSDFDVNEQCFVLAESKPGAIKLRRPFSVPLRIVINRSQPKDRFFGMMVKMRSENDMHSHVVELGKLQFSSGHAAISFSENFSELDNNFVPTPNEYGKYNIYCYLVYRVAVDGNEDQWVPVSEACAWPYIR